MVKKSNLKLVLTDFVIVQFAEKKRLMNNGDLMMKTDIHLMTFVIVDLNMEPKQNRDVLLNHPIPPAAQHLARW